MNTMSIEKRVQILNLLVEGNSMRSVERIVGCSTNTVTKLPCAVSASEFYLPSGNGPLTRACHANASPC